MMKYILYFLLLIFITTNTLGQSKTLLVKRRHISLITQQVRIDWDFDERKGQWVITKDSLPKPRELSGKKIEWQIIESLPK